MNNKCKRDEGDFIVFLQCYKMSFLSDLQKNSFAVRQRFGRALALLMTMSDSDRLKQRAGGQSAMKDK